MSTAGVSLLARTAEVAPSLLELENAVAARLGWRETTATDGDYPLGCWVTPTGRFFPRRALVEDTLLAVRPLLEALQARGFLVMLTFLPTRPPAYHAEVCLPHTPIEGNAGGATPLEALLRAIRVALPPPVPPPAAA